MWHLYMVRCGDGSLYTGVAIDPEQRLRQHNAGRGSRYVRSKGSAVLVYTETARSQSAARRREYEIKSWSREKKLALINGFSCDGRYGL